MFSWLKKLDPESSGLAAITRQFERMLADGRHVFDAAMGAYLGAADPQVVRGDLVETDMGINRLEREIRRAIVVHATVHGMTEFPACLKLMSIVKDAERIGDYAKNILDLATYRPKKPGGAFFDHLAELNTKISRAIEETRELFDAQDAAGAAAFIERAEVIKDECDDRIVEILGQTEIREVDPADPAATALCYRYLKRVISHARNVVTSLVVPVDRLDYFDESYETRDEPPPL